MKTTEIGPKPCPQCGAPNDMATGMDNDGSPEPGDVSLCYGCGAVLVFTQDLSSRQPTPEEEVAIYLRMPADFRAKFIKLQEAIKAKSPSAPSHPPTPDRSNDPSADQT